MTDATILFRSEPKSDESSTMAKRLRERGVTVLDEQANMLLVTGPSIPIKQVVEMASGWILRADKIIPRPDTRVRATKRPR